jgi:hypothetical protein
MRVRRCRLWYKCKKSTGALQIAESQSAHSHHNTTQPRIADKSLQKKTGTREHYFKRLFEHGALKSGSAGTVRQGRNKQKTVLFKRWRTKQKTCLFSERPAGCKKTKNVLLPWRPSAD